MALPIEGMIQGAAPPRYGITPDGKRFLVLLPQTLAGNQPRPQINVVLNWHEELKQRVPTN